MHAVSMFHAVELVWIMYACSEHVSCRRVSVNE